MTLPYFYLFDLNSIGTYTHIHSPTHRSELFETFNGSSTSDCLWHSNKVVTMNLGRGELLTNGLYSNVEIGDLLQVCGF